MLDEEEDSVGILILSFASTLFSFKEIKPAATKPLDILIFEKNIGLA